MKFKSIVPFVVGLIVLQSCATTKNDVLWVGGIKTECDSGAGKTECLQVFKGEDFKDDKWENMSTQIEGFKFEEGYMKKIEVKKIDLDAKDVPADASSVKYTFIKELDKKEDPRFHLKGNWVLAKFNGEIINRMVVLPTLNFDLKEMRVSGNGGCNLYSADVEKLTSKEIKIKSGLATLKACANENIEGEYNKKLSEIETYNIKEGVLSFYDKNGKEVLSYIKVPTAVSTNPIVGEWKNTKINGVEIKAESIPVMVFDLGKMIVGGTDGCNSYNSTIKNLTDSDLVFGDIASTKMMCADMEIPKLFLDAMRQVTIYKLDGEKLYLMNEEGKEMLMFAR